LFRLLISPKLVWQPALCNKSYGGQFEHALLIASFSGCPAGSTLKEARPQAYLLFGYALAACNFLAVLGVLKSLF
jgi:hypothetical protein